MPAIIEIIQADITTLAVDAIVNAARIDNGIHRQCRDISLNNFNNCRHNSPLKQIAVTLCIVGLSVPKPEIYFPLGYPLICP